MLGAGAHSDYGLLTLLATVSGHSFVLRGFVSIFWSVVPQASKDYALELSRVGPRVAVALATEGPGLLKGRKQPALPKGT